jgi:hypothetical protein
MQVKSRVSLPSELYCDRPARPQNYARPFNEILIGSIQSESEAAEVIRVPLIATVLAAGRKPI